MSSSVQPRRRTLVTAVRRALDVLVGDLVQRLHAAGYPGIRAAHSQVFENLDPEGTRLTTLAERAHMAHSSMSELVTGLERLGYVERVPDPADGRVRMVRLTTTGSALQRRAVAELADIEAVWVRRLGPNLGPGLAQALRLIAVAEPLDPTP